MSDNNVINIKNTLKARQLLASFDSNLDRLITKGAEDKEQEVAALNLMSEWLEEAIENGVAPEDLVPRVNEFAQFALSRGYTQYEVEELVTMRPNPNGLRPK